MAGTGKLSAIVLGFACALFASGRASADYNANLSGTVEFVAAYTDGDYIYFRLTNQPISHPVCNPAYFVIPGDVPQNRRNQMYAALLAAKYTGQPIEIGYDASVECAGGFIRVYRVG